MKLLAAAFCFFSFGVLVCSQAPAQVNCALAVVRNNPFGVTFFRNHSAVSSAEPAGKIFEDLVLIAGMKDSAGEISRILLLDAQGRNKFFADAVDMSRCIDEIFSPVEAGDTVLFRLHVD